MKSMSQTQRAVVLLVVQAALVLSIAGKYLYERKTCPRVWVRTAQYDPSLPLRGRYLALQLAVDACSLPRDEAHHIENIVTSSAPDFRSSPRTDGYWRWDVRPVAQDGKLVPLLASDTDRPEQTDEVTVWGNRPCNRANLSKNVEYFVSDAAKSPFPLKPHEELWVEVTVPPMGPPRPIQLAISKDGVFAPLTIR
jgi:hypothetical protein